MKKLLQTIKVIFTAAVPVDYANEVTIAVHGSGRLTQINRKPKEDSCRLGTFNRTIFVHFSNEPAERRIVIMSTSSRVRTTPPA